MDRIEQNVWLWRIHCSRTGELKFGYFLVWNQPREELSSGIEDNPTWLIPVLSWAMKVSDSVRVVHLFQILKETNIDALFYPKIFVDRNTSSCYTSLFRLEYPKRTRYHMIRLVFDCSISIALTKRRCSLRNGQWRCWFHALEATKQESTRWNDGMVEW